ncbi:Pyruvate/ketoisovalerate oxidoreductase [Desulfarculus baarsii DSM 2075]|uniref:Pyruvate/ketoisovalerate oxidoreductase n=1 Tax=Desulfarculus baarsii (strain ATCC 33931 / DSM 2075 / LMG 7858 / VKM B-1802 / 2st14) TaxID=644282 RepID=E1QMF9_DESB2|nr:2-oxoacid:acceptor oxidoreductase family protein [Desulfarculus baarsii]ADK86202.1 Pyruvate/ketoisovalerate oxidoreductase [Desulfarculus baarsii DSM 2075]
MNNGRAPLPKPRMEVRLAGSGGQGLLLAGLVLAEAAGLHEGREVAMAQSYGPEARGGASKAEVIVSDEPIDFPQCDRVDVLLALTQEAADAYCWDLDPEATIIVDGDLVSHPPTSRAIGLPFTAAARDKLGKVMVANVVALGAISQLTGLVGRRALEKALQARTPAAALELNKKALALGFRLARERAGLAAAFEPEPSAEDV